MSRSLVYLDHAATTPVRPEVLEVMAWTEYEGDREIMGLSHVDLHIEGVQFHPESILTPEGSTLLGNFLQLAGPKGASHAVGR